MNKDPAISQELAEYAQARQEFNQKQKELKTGFLILCDKTVIWKVTKKEMNAWIKNELTTKHNVQWGWVDLEKWHEWKENIKETVDKDQEIKWFLRNNEAKEERPQMKPIEL